MTIWLEPEVKHFSMDDETHLLGPVFLYSQRAGRKTFYCRCGHSLSLETTGIMSHFQKNDSPFHGVNEECSVSERKVLYLNWLNRRTD